MSSADRTLVVIMLAVLVGVAGCLLWQSIGRLDENRPGTPLRQSIGIAAGTLMLVSVAHMAFKRSEGVDVAKRRLQLFHMLVGSLAVGLALIHSGTRLGRPPGLILMGAVGLALSGLYGRLVSPHRLGRTFGRGGDPFRPARGMDPELSSVLLRKRQLMAALNPAKPESIATLHRVRDWGRHPVIAWRHFLLSARERRLQRATVGGGWGAVGLPERAWRLVHLWLAAFVIVGLVAHVVTTVFFAGYVAGGGRIYWWHLRQ